MHFRVRKNVVQLIRMRYEPERKRGKATVVGSVRLGNLTLPPDLLSQLTQEEVSEFERWVATKHQIDELRRQLAALTLADSMSEAEAWFATAGHSSTARDTAVGILVAWQSLRAALAKQHLLD